jgi:hypothetical protein
MPRKSTKKTKSQVIKSQKKEDVETVFFQCIRTCYGGCLRLPKKMAKTGGKLRFLKLSMYSEKVKFMSIAKHLHLRGICNTTTKNVISGNCLENLKIYFAVKKSWN